MTDRHFVYENQIPLDRDVLLTQMHTYIGLAKLAAAVLGTTQILNGFACTPTAPATLTVDVGPGEIYSLQNIDNTNFGSISLDNTHQIPKQGIILDSTNLSCPAPINPGQSINYLIQVAFSESDTDLTVLPYFNASNIQVPWSGPNNSGASQPTERTNAALVAVKTGIAAATGSQTTPSPDSGYTGAWVVTVNYGDTTIVSNAITRYSSDSFILETLTQKVSIPTGDLRWAQLSAIQSGAFRYGVDTGSANAIVTSLTPTIASYTAGLIFSVKIANNNTGATTINANGVGVANIKRTDGSALQKGDLIAGQLVQFEYDGSNFQLYNPASWASKYSVQNGSYIYIGDGGSTNAYTATLTPVPSSYVTGMQVQVKIANTNTGASTLNVNSLGTKSIILTNGNAIKAGDLPSGMVALFQYDGTAFQLLNPATWASQYDVQSGKFIYAVDSSNTNTYAITLSPVPASLTAGMQFNVKFVHANTGASTLNVNGLGAVTITTVNGSALSSGVIVANGVYPLIYNGTNFILLNVISNPAASKPDCSFYAYQGTSQSVGSGGSIVTINTIAYDTSSTFNTAGFAWQPTVPGRYMVGGQVATNTQVQLSFSISKTGATVVANSTGTNTAVYIGGQTLVNMGATDYIQLNVSAPGTATNTSNNINLTYMWGYGPV
jgi:hypothetical protein